MKIELELNPYATPSRLATLCNLRAELPQNALCPCSIFQCPFGDKACWEIIAENWEDFFAKAGTNEQSQD